MLFRAAAELDLKALGTGPYAGWWFKIPRDRKIFFNFTRKPTPKNRMRMDGSKGTTPDVQSPNRRTASGLGARGRRRQRPDPVVPGQAQNYSELRQMPKLKVFDW